MREVIDKTTISIHTIVLIGYGMMPLKFNIKSIIDIGNLMPLSISLIFFFILVFFPLQKYLCKNKYSMILIRSNNDVNHLIAVD